MAKVMDKTDEQAAPEVLHFTAAERAARGKAARAEVPRTSHAGFELIADRDPVQILMDQAASRVPELVPIRYGRMLVSPFTFFRGAALIMAADLASTPRSGLPVQLCGELVTRCLLLGVVAGDNERLGDQVASPALVFLLALLVGFDDAIGCGFPAV